MYPQTYASPIQFSRKDIFVLSLSFVTSVLSSSLSSLTPFTTTDDGGLFSTFSVQFTVSAGGTIRGTAVKAFEPFSVVAAGCIGDRVEPWYSLNVNCEGGSCTNDNFVGDVKVISGWMALTVWPKFCGELDCLASSISGAGFGWIW